MDAFIELTEDQRMLRDAVERCLGNRKGSAEPKAGNGVWQCLADLDILEAWNGSCHCLVGPVESRIVCQIGGAGYD